MSSPTSETVEAFLGRLHSKSVDDILSELEDKKVGGDYLREIGLTPTELSQKTIPELFQLALNKGLDGKEIFAKKTMPEKDQLIDMICKDEIDEKRSLKGFYYERLWDICIKFGVVSPLLTLPISQKGKRQTCHIFGNPNVDSIPFTENCWKGGELNKYLSEPVVSGSSGGYSDITLLNKKDTEDVSDEETLCFISVKYYHKEKDVASYDIGKLCTLLRKHSRDKRTINTYILVNDKKKAVEKFKKQHESSDIMMKYINPGGDYEHILDKSDLIYYFSHLKKLLEQFNYLQDYTSIGDFEKYLGNLKQPFIPRFHQKMFMGKIRDLLGDGETKILVGAIPRSGKSFIMAGTILDYVVRHTPTKKRMNFMIMTPAPNETFPEYASIFHDSLDFAKLNIDVRIVNSKQAVTNTLKKKTHNHTVFLVSKQMLGWKDGLDTGKAGILHTIQKRIDEIIGKTTFNLIFLDEAHFGMSTRNSQDIVSIIDGVSKQTPKIFVTATYNKPLSAYGITEKCKITWDLTDVQFMQTFRDLKEGHHFFKGRFGGKVYGEAVTYFGTDLQSIQKTYANFPKPYLITSVWDKDFLQVESDKIGGSGYGFDMNSLFVTDGTEFINPEQITEMLRYYLGTPDRGEGYDKQAFYRNRGILPRIKRICTDKCRTLQTQHVTSQLWFLPLSGGKGDTIEKKVIALLSLLNHKSEFRDIQNSYHFYVAVEIKGHRGTHGNVTYMGKPHNIKTEIQGVESQIRDGKLKADNLIILAGNRLQLGISLKNVDIVTLWNTISSPDAIFQMLFRSMTEVDVPPCETPNRFCEEKKFGFMVDMNPQRALMNVMLFGESCKKSGGSGEELHRDIANMVNIDEDVFLDKYDGTPEDKHKFVRDLFNKLHGELNTDVENIKKLTEHFTYEPSLLVDIAKGLRHVKLTKGKHVIQSADEGFQKPQKDKPKKGEPKKPGKIDKIPPEKLAAELISEVISLLNIFTMYLTEDVDCILSNDSSEPAVVDQIGELKERVFRDTELHHQFLKVLNGRLGGHPDTEFDADIVNKVIGAINNPQDINAMSKLVMAQKKKYYTIKEPEKLLEYINRNLTPKETERKQSGEVFTPISLVNEMLDKLPEEVWRNPAYRWLDPAVGIGNFPIIVYLRLMEGLAGWEPDEEKRRKHILEKMLFMVEISEKSIIILNKVLCGAKYKLNIHPKSFLDADYKPASFDVIMGNPPYNEGGVGKGGGVFWKKFVEKSLKLLSDSGYLVMIHPPGWRKPSGERASGGDVWKSFRKYNLVFVKISDVKIKHFPRVDYYVLSKTDAHTSTHVINDFEGTHTDARVDLHHLPFIPHLVTPITLSILHKVFSHSGKKFQIVRDQSFKPNKSDIGKSGLPHAFYYDVSTRMYVISHKTYQKRVPDYISRPKIIMTYKGGKRQSHLYPVYYSQPMGGTANTMYQLTNPEYHVPTLVSLLSSPLIHFILKITQYSEPPNYINEFKILNMVSIPDKPLKSMTDIYEFYGINKTEQQFIDGITSPKKKPKESIKTPKKEKPLVINVAKKPPLSIGIVKKKTPLLRDIHDYFGGFTKEARTEMKRRHDLTDEQLDYLIHEVYGSDYLTLKPSPTKLAHDTPEDFSDESDPTPVTPKKTAKKLRSKRKVQRKLRRSGKVKTPRKR